ncbi:FCS-Like Zinc finger 17-like [Prosopis cineraria]|uniref:FCS-Like Zinc finger 17-like n=1 Tax=Prosopis cineraria TaxID=364024 RepID=UPI00240FF8E5|nr:FCS-Like Zinc finger 17-like [Prosopis cineraria]XP_054794311.1 FCS-Like Zinc finger 17-like [Prosopis cineraria]
MVLPEFSKSSCAESSMNVGLRLLPQISIPNNSKSNVLLKSAVRKGDQTRPNLDQDFCYLKTCNLCNKKLSPDKDIYMYRGDEGFCSVECRNRQIVMDEMKELDSSRKKMVSSCWNESRRLETRLILKDLQMQRLKSKPCNPRHQNHWAIVS